MRFISKLVSVPFAILALAACTSPQNQNQLPPYAQREAGGAVRVDLELASNGSARLNPENQIELSFNDNSNYALYTRMDGG